MKRLFISLIMLALLSGCYADRLPTYELPEVSESSRSSADEPIALQTNSSLSLPTGKEMLRLRQNKFALGQDRYLLDEVLSKYDPELDRWLPLCNEERCNHYDESCPAWFGVSDTPRFFALRGQICYCVELNTDNALHFYAQDINTGEKMTYYRLPSSEKSNVVLSDAAICGESAILNFDLVTEGESEKMHHVLALNLHNANVTTLMQRPILNGELYDLWGMTEEDIILSYLHAGGNEPFSNSVYCDTWGTEDYVTFLRRQHRWVLLEYPIAENTKWSKEIAEASDLSTLGLYNYSNFYNGTLYYCFNNTVFGYDLSEHKTYRGFTQEDIENMVCLDGKIFLKTSDGQYLYYDLATNESTCFAQGEELVYFPFAESEEELFCYRTDENQNYETYYAIEKEAFYEKDFSKMRPVP